MKTCTASTCSSLGKNCNSWSDGCGGTLNCGSCSSGYTCTSGVCTSTGTGNTYYISTTGIDSSTRDGSASAPWKSLNYACSRVTTSGSIIHVIAGTYAESSTCNLATGVSIEGESKTNTIISSSVGSSSYAISLSSGSSNTNGAQHISNIRIKSATDYSTLGAIYVENRGNVEISNVEIINFKEFGIVMHNGESSTSFATGNSIHDSTITNSGAYVGTCCSDGDARGSIDINSQDGLQIYNNVITVDRPNGDNGNCIDGVEGYLKNVKIYNNVLNKKRVPGKTWDFSIEFWDIMGGLEIYGNNITGSIDLVGVNKGTSTFGANIHDNIIGQPSPTDDEGTRGLMIEAYTGLRTNYDDVTFSRNTVKNVAAGININLADSSSTLRNFKCDYNVFYNIGETSTDYKGWGIYYSTYSSNLISNIDISNNVWSGLSSGPSTMWGIELPPVSGSSNIYVRNNIVVDFDYAPVYSRTSSLSNLYMQNNIFYNNGNSDSPKYSGSYTNSNNQIGVNPLITSDFHLNAGSPAINAGIAISGLTSDRDGKSIIGNPDIGAYEYQGTTCTAESNSAFCSRLVKQCGSVTANDNCGNSRTVSSCGSCTSPTTCSNGLCIASCTPYCTGKNCGSDGCGGSCGSCSTGYTCTNNVCTIINSGTGNTYYISPSGSDSTGDGSINRPWFSLNKAWTAISAGDTIYMRGGTYRYSERQTLSGVSGTADKPINVFAYPGEKPIITKGTGFTSEWPKVLVYLIGDYFHFKGLEIMGHTQEDDYVWDGLRIEDSNYCTFELLNIHHNGAGMELVNTNNCLVLNSDIHDNQDPLTSYDPYGNADGLAIEGDYGKTNTVRGCRFWWNTDDGLDLWYDEGNVIVEDSWAFWNGFIPGTFNSGGDGNGFKLGNTQTSRPNTVLRTITNCLAAQNKLFGYLDNDAQCNMELYNNLAYNDCYMGYETWCGGFHFTLISGIPYYIKNNIAYESSGTNAELDVLTNVNHNSWDSSGISLDNNDFANLDVSQLLSPRESDGSLPTNVTFGHLASGSDLIDKGINVGLPYLGNAPDLGAYERQ
jgi:hypothetical protein